MKKVLAENISIKVDNIKYYFISSYLFSKDENFVIAFKQNRESISIPTNTPATVGNHETGRVYGSIKQICQIKELLEKNVPINEAIIKLRFKVLKTETDYGRYGERNTMYIWKNVHLAYTDL